MKRSTFYETPCTSAAKSKRSWLGSSTGTNIRLDWHSTEVSLDMLSSKNSMWMKEIDNINSLLRSLAGDKSCGGKLRLNASWVPLKWVKSKTRPCAVIN